jgi:hypothetical protein
MSTTPIKPVIPKDAVERVAGSFMTGTFKLREYLDSILEPSLAFEHMSSICAMYDKACNKHELFTPLFHVTSNDTTITITMFHGAEVIDSYSIECTWKEQTNSSISNALTVIEVYSRLGRLIEEGFGHHVFTVRDPVIPLIVRGIKRDVFYVNIKHGPGDKEEKVVIAIVE